MPLTKNKLQENIAAIREAIKRLEGTLDTVDDLSQDPHANRESIENEYHSILTTLENIEDRVGDFFSWKNS